MSGDLPETDVRTASDWLRRGGFVAYPTETVWGLGACADQPRAIERLMDWKGRGQDAPLAVLVSSPDAAKRLGCELPPPVLRLMAAFWPGPLMLVVPCAGRFAPGVARSDGALGLRCSPHPTAAGLVRALEEGGLGPLTSTSLNRSGEPPARDATAARGVVGAAATDSLDAPLFFFAGEHDAGGAPPSTVVDCTQAEPEILRSGAIDPEAVARAWAE